jgi:hypothetical protein
MPEEAKSGHVKLWRIAFAMMAVAAGIIGLFWFWPSIVGPPKLVEGTASSVNFFRFKASYNYKGKNGLEPLDFDIVAGCAVQITKYITGDAPGISSRTPTKYALPTSDGAAVMVQVPRVCDGGTTDNGRIPKDFLPIAVTYESANDLSLGLMYASEDAYDGPLSKLEFKGATLEKASEEEFRTFITGDGFKKNLISLKSSRDFVGGPGDRIELTEELKQDPRMIWKQRMTGYCLGARRLKAPEELKKYLRTLWQPGEPEYWYVDRQHSTHMMGWLRDLDTGKKRPFPLPKFDGKTFREYDLPVEVWGAGAQWRDGRGLIGGFSKILNKPRHYPPDYYPLLMDVYPSEVRKINQQTEFLKNTILKDEKYKGFYFCTAPLAGEANIYYLQKFNIREMKRFIFIDGERVVRLEDSDESDAEPIGELLFFERDEYIVWIRQLDL